ncbi:hypothetical protein BASA84_001739 [Batrachochytrium salamandrivorans]|nr:hypothetical protein BASA84_001739 [Batrachochytrium salamandrivorans]
MKHLPKHLKIPSLFEPTLRDDVLAKVESAGYDQAAIESFVETHELGVVKTAYYLYLADAGPAPQSEPEPESEPELPSELLSELHPNLNPTSIRTPIRTPIQTQA